MVEITCSACGGPAVPGTQVCQRCGGRPAGTPIATPAPTGDLPVAELAVKRGLLTLAQVAEAMELARSGKAASLEEALIQKGYLTLSQFLELSREPGTAGGSEVLPGYQLVRSISKSEYCHTYEARQNSSGRTLIVKLFQMDVDPVEQGRLNGALSELTRLSHPAMAACVAAGIRGGRPFYVSERLDGIDLENLVRSDGPLEEELSRGMAAQLLGFLEYIHALDVLHGDLRPRKIVLADDGRVRVRDTGIPRSVRAMVVRRPGPALLRLAPYAAPEFLKGEPVDARTDLYSLGCTLYYLSTGRPPHSSESPTLLIEKQLNESVDPPCKVNPDISESFSDWILRMMKKHPQVRFQSAREALAELEDLMLRRPPAPRQRPSRSASGSRPFPAARPAKMALTRPKPPARKRSPLPVIVASACALVLLALVGLLATKSVSTTVSPELVQAWKEWKGHVTLSVDLAIANADFRRAWDEVTAFEQAHSKAMDSALQAELGRKKEAICAAADTHWSSRIAPEIDRLMKGYQFDAALTLIDKKRQEFPLFSRAEKERKAVSERFESSCREIWSRYQRLCNADDLRGAWEALQALQMLKALNPEIWKTGGFNERLHEALKNVTTKALVYIESLEREVLRSRDGSKIEELAGRLPPIDQVTRKLNELLETLARSSETDAQASEARALLKQAADHLARGRRGEAESAAIMARKIFRELAWSAAERGDRDRAREYDQLAQQCTELVSRAQGPAADSARPQTEPKSQGAVEVYGQVLEVLSAKQTDAAKLRSLQVEVKLLEQQVRDVQRRLLVACRSILMALEQRDIVVSEEEAKGFAELLKTVRKSPDRIDHRSCFELLARAYGPVRAARKSASDPSGTAMRTLAMMHLAAALQLKLMKVQNVPADVASLLGIEAGAESWSTRESRSITKLNSMLRQGRFTEEADKLLAYESSAPFEPPAYQVYRVLMSCLRCAFCSREEAPKVQGAALRMTAPAGPSEAVIRLRQAIERNRRCSKCQGLHTQGIKCYQCDGKGWTAWNCPNCNGWGYKEVQVGRGLANVPCPRAAAPDGTPFDPTIDPEHPHRFRKSCARCQQTGRLDCTSCKKEWSPIDLRSICRSSVCETCDGSGFLEDSSGVMCLQCYALGMRFVAAAPGQGNMERERDLIQAPERVKWKPVWDAPVDLRGEALTLDGSRGMAAVRYDDVFSSPLSVRLRVAAKNFSRDKVSGWGFQLWSVDQNDRWIVAGVFYDPKSGETFERAYESKGGESNWLGPEGIPVGIPLDAAEVELAVAVEGNQLRVSVNGKDWKTVFPFGDRFQLGIAAANCELRVRSVPCIEVNK